MSELKPYRDSSAGKKVQIATMFDRIAPRYDFLNHTLSFGIDKMWRRKAIRLISNGKPETILDVATGTGDFAIAALKSGAKKITGIDISKEMVAVGIEKVRKLGLEDKIELMTGDSEAIQFPDMTFDAATVAFGVRNFENLGEGLDELFRVLKRGGTLCVLEFSNPHQPLVKFGYNLYSRYLLPWFGRMVSGDKSAYTYLPESVKEFPDGEKFITFMKESGFVQIREYRLTFGIATIYIGKKG
ncbi:MAG: bifunctional demethylmenaquinone methyltransferase/2-methoxy-6-polyprenyl-1,4-benzoquinol methylase UbiE [Bacteroidetes bacterium]|nr:bifunctional demethylmenaquinone methyltransferase/2-methoxy-6-polyprenyl-1,4-benzoquinol methylase UbiE [Bacteroidota bacterium]MCL6101750.1 bifunctional demethylmenaquinone methyltransferase/2-methoxy-6-polyprenyl-1,4-benzoquinol methylase UbiE [Bacteroidota bacterium]